MVHIAPVTPDKNKHGGEYNKKSREESKENNQESRQRNQRFIKFLNRMYRLSRRGELTKKRVRLERLQKIAILVFSFSVLIVAILFSYMFFTSPESIFAKKSLENNYELQRKASSTSNEYSQSNVTTVDSQESTQESTETFPEIFSEASSDISDENTLTDIFTNIPKESQEKLSEELLNATAIETEKKAQEISSEKTNEKNEASDNLQAKEISSVESKLKEPLSEVQEGNFSNALTKLSKLSSLSELAIVSYAGALLFDSLENKNAIEKLKYGSFVKVIEKREIGGVNFSKIAYYGKELDSKLKIGWIKTSELSFVENFLGTSQNIALKEFNKVPARVQKVRGIYISRHKASSRDTLEKFLNFAKRTNLNAFVIDVKDDDGFMLFKSEAASKYVPKANIAASYSKKEIKEILNKLKSNGIYLIARIVCFKDPAYASTHVDRAIVYKDTGQPYTGIYKVPWASAYDRQLWQYNIDIAKEAIEVGFDEIQYDYVRFPEISKENRARVNLRQVGNESLAEAIYKFLVKSKMELSPYNIPLAADIFGLVSTAVDDMGIGQYWELVSSVVDYVCPMIYPSHYANGSFGLPVPDAYPYETVYRSTLDGIIRNKYVSNPGRLRPWIQSFTATWVKGHIPYGENEIRKQIKALKDLGIEEYMLWNASNRYIEMKYD